MITNVYIYIYESIYAYWHIYPYLYIYTRIIYTDKRMNINLYIKIPVIWATRIWFLRTAISSSMSFCSYIFFYMYMYVYIYVWIYIYIDIFIYIYIHIYTHIYIPWCLGRELCTCHRWSCCLPAASPWPYTTLNRLALGG
jgi:hypothetical protein